MKKIIGIISTFLIVGLLVCIGLGFLLPSALPPKAMGSGLYKFLSGLEFFINYLPGFVFASFTVSFAIHFGQNSAGSTRRYSSAMLKRFRFVMIASLFCVTVLSLANETIGIKIKQKKNQIQNQPKILTEYIRVAKKLYEQGFSKRAKKYAQAALFIDPKSTEASDILTLTQQEENLLFNDDINILPISGIEKDEKSNILDEKKVFTAYNYLVKAQEAYKTEKWFDAHYFAEQGLVLATSKDPNQQELRNISTNAWNNITQIHELKQTEEQKIFSEKYRGYKALIEKDDLKAYYIFKALSESSVEVSRDSDVIFFLDVAQKRVEEKTFFIDETLELENFEDQNNIYFTYIHSNGTKDICFFKGVNSVKSSDYSLQYLRDFYIVSFNKDGKWEKTIHTPYAKVLSVSVDVFSQSERENLGIAEEVQTIPYILLKSVGRSDESLVSMPEFTFNNQTVQNTKDYVFYPMDFSEFTKIEQSSSEPSCMPFFTITKLAFKSKSFGFSQEMFGQQVLNRCLYPLFLLVLLVLLASFAWNNRLTSGQYFKFAWFLSFPALILALFVFFDLCYFAFKLLNYAILVYFTGVSALFVGIGFYLVIFILSIFYFLSRTSRS